VKNLILQGFQNITGIIKSQNPPEVSGLEFGIFFLYSRNNIMRKTPRPTGTPLKKRGSVTCICNAGLLIMMNFPSFGGVPVGRGGYYT